MPAKVTLSDTTRKQLNDDLKELQDIRAEIEKALKAGVPEVETLKTRCMDCEERIAKLKAIYWPNKR